MLLKVRPHSPKVHGQTFNPLQKDGSFQVLLPAWAFSWLFLMGEIVEDQGVLCLLQNGQLSVCHWKLWSGRKRAALEKCSIDRQAALSPNGSARLLFSLGNPSTVPGSQKVKPRKQNGLVRLSISLGVQGAMLTQQKQPTKNGLSFGACKQGIRILKQKHPLATCEPERPPATLRSARLPEVIVRKEPAGFCCPREPKKGLRSAPSEQASAFLSFCQREVEKGLGQAPLPPKIRLGVLNLGLRAPSHGAPRSFSGRPKPRPGRGSPEGVGMPKVSHLLLRRTVPLCGTKGKRGNPRQVEESPKKGHALVSF